MYKLTLILMLMIFVVVKSVQCQSEIIFKSDEKLLETGDACVSIRNGIEMAGVCTPVQECTSIVSNIRSNTFNTTVCGYDNHTQIICCPNTLRLSKNMECYLNSNETGIIKFLSDCPELNSNDGNAINKLCTNEICSDLVCCPVMLTSRLKNVCWKVDHPVDTLQLRLLLNEECSVKELNIKGRYQTACSFADRNPHLLSKLKGVCKYDECKDWYCCPIEENDIFNCTARRIDNSFATLVGPKCIDSKSGRNGTCRQKFNCFHSGLDHSGLDECGSFCCDVFVCCPDDLNQINQSISSRACNSYTKYLSIKEIEIPISTEFSSCTTSIVAGGVPVKSGEYSHMAALGYQPKQEILWHCGGSLISDRYVLTAGHCLTDRHIGPVKKVRLGGINLRNDVKTTDCPEDFDVANLIPHPEYKSKYIYNDIGLIQLAIQVKFNYHIRPICLPPSGDLLKHYISMGWGATGYAKDLSIDLIKVHQEIFSYEECQIQYDVGRRFPNGIINDTQICAGSRHSIQSTCVGDSGGPLIGLHSSNKHYLHIYGIVSFGTACGFAGSAGVYTKVFPFTKWIEETVWAN